MAKRGIAQTFIRNHSAEVLRPRLLLFFRIHQIWRDLTLELVDIIVKSDIVKFVKPDVSARMYKNIYLSEIDL